MSLTSTYFIIFMLILIPVYYLVPKKIQWCVLLVASLIFYCFGGWTNLAYVIFTSLTAFASTTIMDKLSDKQKLYLKENKESLTKEQKKSYKESVKKKRKAYMLTAVILNIVLLCFFKFLNPINSILESKSFNTLDIIIPLGISYFTLQTVGYIVDVYWNNVKAEKNYLKVLLFVSFFPQVTQGPISDFKQLSSELFTEHELTYKNYSWGFQRLIWGFFKKLVMANIMLPYVKDLFENYTSYAGITLFIGIFVVMLQLYADFSGYMDIVCGACEMLGIRLAENFNRPFFSKSLSEFWRRWHITLGAWFKKYVFFTVGTSRFANSLSGKVKNKFGADAGEKTVSTVALLAIWFSIGLWHSTYLSFILWGVMNGLIMIFSVWMEPVYAKARALLRIKDSSRLLKIFRILRTFFIVSVLELFSDTNSVRKSIKYFLCIVKNIVIIPKNFGELFPFVDNTTNFLIMIIGLIFVFVFSCINRKNDFRLYYNKVPIFIKIFIAVILYFVIIIVSIPLLIEQDGGFMYAQF